MFEVPRGIQCVNIYAVLAFFEVYSYEVAQYINPLGDLYEAFGLCALYLLFVEYAAPSRSFGDELFAAVKSAEEEQSTFDWPRIGWIFVFQFPTVEVLCVFIIEVTEAAGRYCVNSLRPQFGHFWVEILQSISIGACVIAIISFRNRMKKLMKVRRGLAKIVCFKIIVFIRFAQAWVFSILLERNVVKTSPAFSYNDILWGIPGVATCAEMALFSLGFWYALSSTEYGSSAKPQDRPLPLWRAVLDAMNPTDFILGIWRIFPLFGEVHRSGDWKLWRAEAKNRGITGAVRKGAKKYTNRKAGKNSRYQQLDEGLEHLQQPWESHSRTASGTSDSGQYPTGQYTTTSMNAQQMYQPPAGPPSDEARDHLMAKPYQGRSRSTSQSQWNGQRYARTPSPAGRYSADETEVRDLV
ncbi:Uu.00g015870.m01.CDS01 [Anthostomella pinea]|uniref:Uu.00g015870.m01.CDS01 n=1 Tax=Anthostomella pinea TaxID=933095 RepID=A0AAI8VZT8_9PEZI|nr:Uu.00g015870.m01.CDS01 [Anthostomella pinea]